MSYLINLGTANVPSSGIDGREAFDKVNKTTLMTSASLGTLCRLLIFTLGDSMMGYGGGPGYASFLGMARMLCGDPDIYYNEGSYYDNATGEAFPGGPKGWNFAAGGTTTQHMIDVQMRHVRTAYEAGTLPSTFIMSAMQNDKFYGGEKTADTFARMKQALDVLVYEMGRQGIVIGNWPHSQLAQSQWSKHDLDHRMREYCATLPGIQYISILDALKSGVPSEEANTYANYLGWQIPAGTPGRASWDEIHAAPLAARIVGLLVGPALRRLVRAYPKPVLEAAPYDKTLNPYGSRYGAMARLQGTGGRIWNVADPDPTKWTKTPSNNLPAGVDLIYDQSKGIVITPELTGGAKDRKLYLGATGPGTAYVEGALRFSTYMDLPAQSMMAVGHGRWKKANGWGGIALGNAGEGAPGIPSGTIITSFRGHGGYGGADYTMPFELNDELDFRSAPFGWPGGGRTIPMDLGFAFHPGLPVSGGVELDWATLIGVDVPAGY